MFSTIRSFIQAIGASVYKNTIAPIKRWLVNSQNGNADEADKRTASRVLMYLGLLVLSYWFPQAVIIIVFFRNAVFGDVMWTVSSVVVDSINLFSSRNRPAAA